VLGPQADQVAEEIRAAIGSAARAVLPVAPQHARRLRPEAMPAGLVTALGGAVAVTRAEAIHGRILLPPSATIDAAALPPLGARGVAATGAGPQVLFAEETLASWCR